MQQFLHYLLYLHIAAGTLALFMGPIAMLNQNGNALHRNSGKLFFYSMSIIFVSAIVLSIARSNVFLMMIAFFSYHLIIVAKRALNLKKLHLDQKPQAIDWTICIIAGLFYICLIGWGIQTLLILKNNFGYVALVLAFFGCLFLRADLIRLIKKPTDKNHWLFLHIGGMIGGYISTVTAFLVNVVHSDYPVLLWLSPVTVLFPFLRYTQNKFKKKLDKGKVIEELATIKI